MRTFLGETVLDVSKTEFAGYLHTDWALKWIEMYGGIDGAHHKDWVLDQVCRIFHQTPVIMKLAQWDDGYTEHRFSLGDPPNGYWKWVAEMKAGEHGPDTYSYSFGIAP